MGELIGNPLPYKNLREGTDLDTVQTAGVYNLYGKYTNAPFSQSWGFLIVIGVGAEVTQIVTEKTDFAKGIFIRHMIDSPWGKITVGSV